MFFTVSEVSREGGRSNEALLLIDEVVPMKRGSNTK